MNNLIIRNIGKLYTPKKEQFGSLFRYDDVDICIKNGLIEDIAPCSNNKFANNCNGFDILDANKAVVLPGFVDSHTHAIFAETRELEFQMRNQGKSYQEIAASGGGIRNSVRKLRAKSFSELYDLSKKRVLKFLEFGTTTVEIKSGYGLTLKDEIKMLEVIKKLNNETDLDIIATFLGAHEVPDEYRDNRQGYIDLLIQEMLPIVSERKLASACDIFIEKGVYTVEEGRLILSRALELGLDIKVHGDQMTANGGSMLAAELKALSAEHFEYITDEAIDAMIEKGVIFNLIPGAAYFLNMTDYPPARKIIKKGGICALSTDFNPGSCFCMSLPHIMNIASIKMGLTVEEMIWSATYGGAMALRKEKEVGSLEKGKQADLIFLDCKDLEMLPYSMGFNLITRVIKKGAIVK